MNADQWNEIMVAGESDSLGPYSDWLEDDLGMETYAQQVRKLPALVRRLADLEERYLASGTEGCVPPPISKIECRSILGGGDILFRAGSHNLFMALDQTAAFLAESMVTLLHNRFLTPAVLWFCLQTDCAYRECRVLPYQHTIAKATVVFDFRPTGSSPALICDRLLTTFFAHGQQGQKKEARTC